MESLAFLGLLGLGYMAAPKKDSDRIPEGFQVAEQDQQIAVNTPRETDVGRSLSGDLDLQFRLPATGRLMSSDPYPSRVQGGAFQSAAIAVAPSAPEAVTGGAGVIRVQQRPDNVEAATAREGFVSPLTGIAFKQGEFKHNNMVPFFRGQVKQNLYEGANRQMLDYQTGADSLGFAKREQTPLFEPTKQPMGNPFGMESTTEFMGDRMVAPTNRANEPPVEPIRVGPGLNQGFTHIPSGGFQQQAGEEFMLERLPRTNDLRVATNPKLTYAQPVVEGAHFITTSGTAETVGEVRKYTPDTFYINEKGERNFVTTGADLKSTARATQVLKTTTRMDTATEYAGIAGQAEGGATYTVGAAKAPLVKQHGPFGFRNADASSYFDKNTDADQNDYGKSSVEILPNERFYTGERVHATNANNQGQASTLPLQDGVKPTRAEELVENFRGTGNFTAIGGGGMAEKPTMYDPTDVARTTIKETTIDNDWLGVAGPGGSQPKLTVYDPNDVARTTIKETTIDNDWLGISAPNQAQKLTVYDPDDIARVTGRNTLDQIEWTRNGGTKDGLMKATTRIQDGVRHTQKAAISGKSAYAGTASAFVNQEMAQGAARNVRHYAQKETISQGRVPTNSSTKVFNGEDYVNLTYKKLIVDSVNDRQPVVDRVAAETSSLESIGIQRPRAALKLDVSAERNAPAFVSSLERNPYVIPLHVVAHGNA